MKKEKKKGLNKSKKEPKVSKEKRSKAVKESESVTADNIKKSNKKGHKNKELRPNQKKLDNVEDKDIESLDSKKVDKPISRGARKLKDLLAPCGFSRTDENTLGVGSKYVRSFVVNGYPSVVQVGWLDKLYNSEEDLDVSFHILPTDERSALDELNMEITKQEAQLHYESKSGNIRNLGKLQTKIEQLYAQRAKLEQNHEKMYHSCITANLHCDTQDELDKATHALVHTLGARKVDVMSSYLRQDESYKSALPFGENYMDDKYRSINTGGLVASFPFYNAEISHPNGVFLGLNMVTGTPMFIDMYNRQILTNGNMTVFGSSGSGKTFLVSLLTARSTVKDIATAIVDPEGEYIYVTHELGGKHVEITPDSTTRINPFDLEPEYDYSKNESVINVKAKIADLINLFAVMCEGIDSEQKSVMAMILKELYEKDWGITSDPKSLYTNEGSFDKVTGEYKLAGEPKKMPRLSDFYKKLKAYVEMNPQPNLQKLVNSLLMFTEGHVYDIWDTYTSEDLKNLKGVPVITFDVSKLEESVVRPIGMYVCLTWIWESFVKKDHKQKKRIVVDEAWMLTDPNMAGSEYTASFLNVAARRCRKRNASLCIASQSFNEFVDNPQGKAVLMNSSVNMFLKTEPIAIDAVQQTFKLSDGEKEFLMSAKRGQVLIRMNSESCVGLVVPFEYERNLIENPFRNKKAKEDDDDI